MATIGDVLTSPESGYQRINDDNSLLIYNGDWNYITETNNYNGDYHGYRKGANKSQTSLTFYVKSSKLRIIGRYASSYSKDVAIFIDDITKETYSTYNSDSNKYQCLQYEKLDLNNTKITKICICNPVTNGSSGNYEFRIDAIDIDDTGKLCTEIEYLIQEGLEFPVKIANDTITSENDVATYASALVNGERQLLIADKLKKIYVTDGNGGITDISSGGSNGNASIDDENIAEDKVFSNQKTQELIDDVIDKTLDKDTYASETNEGAVKYADNLSVTMNTQPLQYYGTDNDNNLGMHYFPIDTKDNTGMEQRVAINTKANEILTVDSTLDISDNKVLVQCYKFVEGEDAVVSTLKIFDNTEKDNFFYDEDKVEFSDSMHIKTKHNIPLTENVDGYYESETINKNDFLELEIHKVNNTNGIYDYGVNTVCASELSLSYTTSNGVLIESDYNIYDGNYSISNMLYSADYSRCFLTADSLSDNKYIYITLPEEVFIREIKIPSVPYTDWGSTGELLDGEDNILGSFETINSSIITVNKMMDKIKIRLKTGGAYGASLSYLEIKYFDCLFLIKQNDLFYSISSNNYNQGSMQFNSIDSPTVLDMFGDIELLNNDMVVGSETFVPIDKFDSFQLVSTKNIDLTIQGRKSDKQLVVASGSFSTKIAETIVYFKPTVNTDNNSYIKMVISVDEGATWKTTFDNGATWTDLNCTIPLKEYSTLTEDEKTQWNKALTEIDTSGFDISTMETIDFNTIQDKTMMYAYVLYQDTYESVCDNLGLEWQFDAVGTMELMDKNECKISLMDDRVIVVPTSDEDMIKVNILNGVPEGVGSGDIDITEATSEDIQNILNKEW